MAVVEDVSLPASLAEEAAWLIDAERRSWRRCAEWLARLAEFDRAGGWLLDGCASAVEWLILRTGVSRSSAFDKVRVAHELCRRPVLAGAFAGGRLSWSAVRLITQCLGAEPATDEAMVVLAEEATLAEVELAVRAYKNHAGQHRRLPSPETRRRVRSVPLAGGVSRVEIVLTDVEAAELVASIEAGAAREAEACDEPRLWGARMADAALALGRRQLAEVGDGSDRYMLHVVVAHGEGCSLGGVPFEPGEVERIRCDCSAVEHHYGTKGQPLTLGRRSRTWSTAQRRAIAVRDGGSCRWPGCANRHVDVHHLVEWEVGGPTDVAMGVLLCGWHHGAYHRGGFAISGEANDALVFARSDGAVIGVTRPLRR